MLLDALLGVLGALVAQGRGQAGWLGGPRLRGHTQRAANLRILAVVTAFNIPDIRTCICKKMGMFTDLHMQVGNEAATNFYLKQGFKIVQELKNFYYDISPRDCYVMRLNLHGTEDNPVPEPNIISEAAQKLNLGDSIDS